LFAQEATLCAADALSPTVVLRASAEQAKRKRGIQVFLILAIILVVLWLGGFTLMHVSSLLIHLLLLFAVISLILHFVRGSRSA
jgi:hypothetical protein